MFLLLALGNLTILRFEINSNSMSSTELAAPLKLEGKHTFNPALRQPVVLTLIQKAHNYIFA